MVSEKPIWGLVRRTGRKVDDAAAGLPPSATPGPMLTIVPFAAIAIIGQLLAIWNPNPIVTSYFLLSCGLLLLALVALCLRTVRTSPMGPMAILVLYVASVSALEIAEGGKTTGSGVLLVVPLVASALLFHYRETVCASIAVIVSIVVVGIHMNGSPDLQIRRVILWTAICVLVAVPIHALRSHLRASVIEARTRLHQSQTLERAARELASLRTEEEILCATTRLAALVVAPPREHAPVARYLPVNDRGASMGSSRTHLTDALLTCRSVGAHDCPLDSILVGSRATAAGPPRDSASIAGDDQGDVDPGVHAAGVAVRPEGELHGYLYVVADELSISPDRVEGLTALGQLVELSLSNLFAHRRLEDQAMHEERRRIARELHDGLAHELAYIASRSRSAAQLSSDDGVAELARSADRALDEARRAITVLTSREPLMLSESIAQTAEDLGQRYGVPILLKLDYDVNVEPALGEHLLRIVREAICNAVRHGQPSKLTIHLWNDGVRHLVIEDDGIGFDLLGPLHGFGLTSMRERAEAAGGELSMHSEPNAGTRVEVLVP